MRNRLHRWVAAIGYELTLAVGAVGGWQRFCVMVLHALLLPATKGGLAAKSHFLFSVFRNIHPHAHSHAHTWKTVRSSDGFDYTCLFWCAANDSCVHKYQNMELNRVFRAVDAFDKILANGLSFRLMEFVMAIFQPNRNRIDIKCNFFLSFFD